MTDYLAILKRVGIVLVLFGLADIAFMIYSVSKGQSYSSSFNIFAVIAGIFLLRGNLTAARKVTWFAARMLAGFVAAIFLLVPIVPSIGLLLVQAKLNPASTFAMGLLLVAVLVLLVWVYRQLRSGPVLDALEASGRSTTVPKLAFGLGFALVVFLAVALNMTVNGAAGAKAIELAYQKLGPGYNYAFKSIQWGSGHSSAVVAAYNSNEIKYVSVEWSE